MADIELVVKIPEEIRLALINNIQLSLDQQSICDSYIKQAIINGTQLPKGHRFIDADEILNHAFITEDEEGDIFVQKYYCIKKEIMDNALVLFDTLEETEQEDGKTD